MYLTSVFAEEVVEMIGQALPENPPYETPNIVDIFRFYLLLQYGDVQSPEQQKRLNDLCNLMLTILDQCLTGAASPQLQGLRVLFLAVFSSSGKADDKTFAPYYSRWRKSCADGSHTLTRIFGRGMLLQVS